MEMLLVRKWNKPEYTIGQLWVDGRYFCDTLEDKNRLLTSDMTEGEIKSRKVYGRTAIPSGRYEVAWNWSARFKRQMPQILNVKGFEGIRIHAGNTAAHTDGCILCGVNKAVGKVLESKATCERLYNLIHGAVGRERIWITIR